MEKRVLEVEPILVTGCARSGTSLVAGVVSICGAFGGKTRPGNRFNEKGMFENSQIQKIDKEYLRAVGCDPKGQYPLPDTSKLPQPFNWKGDIENAIIAEGYEEGLWFYKSARTCLTWPVWNSAFPQAKWVIVRRRSADIASSCLATSFMNAYDTYEGWIKWINHHENCFVEMVQAGLQVKEIWPERMVKGDYSQMKELIEWLGLEWKDAEIKQFIEPKLWKAKVKQGII